MSDTKWKIHRYAVEATILLVVSYVVFQKMFSFSGSGLVKSVFQPSAAEYIIYGITVGVSYALVARVFIHAKDYFSKAVVPALSFPHYRCLLNNNKEIGNHIKDLQKNQLSLDVLNQKHSYEENLQIIHRNFAEHLIESLKDKAPSGNDIFISIFHDGECSLDFTATKCFQYSSHYDPTMHDTSTAEIDTSSAKYRNFAGTKVIKKKAVVICYKISKSDYDLGTEERRKSIKHYFGIPLKINGSVAGLINIEFHNKSFFTSEDDMKSFYQKEIQAFAYLYEYQLSKRYFFFHLNNKLAA